MSETLVVTLTITTVTSLLSLLVGGVIGWIVRQATYESSSPQMVYGHPEMFDEKGNVVGVAVAKLDLATVVKAYGVVPENTNFGIKANVVSNLLAANDILGNLPSKKTMSKAQLGEKISDATYHLSCWMTMAQVKKMRTQKVVFEDLR